jgi:hypothetical protein
MTALGIATGCLHPIEALGDSTHLIRALDADGIELTFSTAAEVTAADPDMLADLTDTFSFVTVHTPIQDAVTDEDDLKKWVVKSKSSNGSLTELQLQYEFDQNTSYTALDGVKFDSKVKFEWYTQHDLVAVIDAAFTEAETPVEFVQESVLHRIAKVAFDRGVDARHTLAQLEAEVMTTAEQGADVVSERHLS